METPQGLRDYLFKEKDPSIAAGLITLMQVIRGGSKNAAPCTNGKALDAFRFEAVLQGTFLYKVKEDAAMEYFLSKSCQSLPLCRNAVVVILSHISQESGVKELMKACETLTRRRLTRLKAQEISNLRMDIILSVESFLVSNEKVLRNCFRTVTHEVIVKKKDSKTKKESSIHEKRTEKIGPSIRLYGVPVTVEEKVALDHLNGLFDIENLTNFMEVRVGDNPYNIIVEGRVVLEKIYHFTDVISGCLHERKQVIRVEARALQNASADKDSKEIKQIYYKRAEMGFKSEHTSSILGTISSVLNTSFRDFKEVQEISLSDLVN